MTPLREAKSLVRIETSPQDDHHDHDVEELITLNDIGHVCERVQDTDDALLSREHVGVGVGVVDDLAETNGVYSLVLE